MSKRGERILPNNTKTPQSTRAWLGVFCVSKGIRRREDGDRKDLSLQRYSNRKGYFTSTTHPTDHVAEIFEVEVEVSEIEVEVHVQRWDRGFAPIEGIFGTVRLLKAEREDTVTGCCECCDVIRKLVFKGRSEDRIYVHRVSKVRKKGKRLPEVVWTLSERVAQSSRSTRESAKCQRILDRRRKEGDFPTLSTTEVGIAVDGESQRPEPARVTVYAGISDDIGGGDTQRSCLDAVAKRVVGGKKIGGRKLFFYRG